MGEWPNWKRQLPAKQSILNRQTIVDVREYDIKNLNVTLLNVTLIEFTWLDYKNYLNP